MTKKKNIDVFGYLEDVVIKKDLDDFDWFYSGYSKKRQKEIEKELEEDPDASLEISPYRSKCYMAILTKSLYPTVVAWVKTGENVSKQTAEKEVNKFLKTLQTKCKRR